MSLINKMLKDLEARQGAALRGDARPIFHDLQPVVAEHRRRHLAIGAIVLVLAVAAGVYAMQRSTELPLVSALPSNLAASVVPPPAEPVVAVAPETALSEPAAAAPPPAVAKSAPPEAGDAPSAAAPQQAVSAPVRPKVRPEPARIEKVERKPSAEELAAQTFREAARAHANGNPAEAERLLASLLATTPKHTGGRELLATIQRDSGRRSEAQNTLEQGVALVPEHLPFRYQLARMHLDAGNDARAEQLLQDTRRAGHADPELHAFLAAIQQRGGRHAEAVKSYREALALRPEEGRFWLGLGISLEAQHDAAAAQDAYRRALGSGRLAANLAHYAEDRLKVLTAR